MRNSVLEDAIILKNSLLKNKDIQDKPMRYMQYSFMAEVGKLFMNCWSRSNTRTSIVTLIAQLLWYAEIMDL